MTNENTEFRIDKKETKNEHKIIMADLVPDPEP